MKHHLIPTRTPTHPPHSFLTSRTLSLSIQEEEGSDMKEKVRTRLMASQRTEGLQQGRHSGEPGDPALRRSVKVKGINTWGGQVRMKETKSCRDRGPGAQAEHPRTSFIIDLIWNREGYSQFCSLTPHSVWRQRRGTS